MEPLDITAGRLQLRPWAAGDEHALAALLDEAAVARWTPHPSPYTLAHAAARVAEDAACWEAGTRAELGVRDATTGRLLAVVGLYRLTPTDAEVGWATAAAARGQGVASQAVGALCRWAFGGLGLLRLEARVEVGNGASRRVAEKAAFALEGVARSAASPGGRTDTWVLSRLAGDVERDTARIPDYPDRSDGLVTLRRWRSDDAAEVARACSDRETARWLPIPVPYALQAGQAYVDGIVPTQWADGTAANVAVVDAADGQLVGAVGLTLRDGLGEVGYWTAPWARGRGVATRAAALHTAWGLEVLGLPRVELLTDVDNLASQRVAERAGFVREGVARAVRPRPRSQERADMVVFRRLPDGT
jgi:RimJ/RimL family protein N-acetyltransferase